MDKLQELLFPLRGLDLSSGYSDQRPGTTVSAVNVRACEPDAGRLRGGSRPGLTPYIDDQLGGEIQDLNLVVLPSGDVLGLSFTDVAILDPTFQLEDFASPPYLLADGTVNWIYVGGSGYYTSPSYTRQATPSITSVSPDFGDFDGGDTITILGSNMGDATSSFDFGGSGATILSNDGETATVTAPSHAASGDSVTVNVTVTTDVGTSPVTASTVYTYGRIQFVQYKNVDAVGNAAFGTTFAADVVSGHMIVVPVVMDESSTGGTTGTVTITDSQGNSYTQIGSYRRFNGNTANLSLWYTIASADGSLTVTCTPSGQSDTRMLPAEYKGTSATPLDSNAGGVTTASGTNWTTGTVAVSNANEAIIACFAQSFYDGAILTFTPAANCNLRASAGALISLFLVDQLNLDADDSVSGTVEEADLEYGFIGASFIPGS